MKKVKQEHGGTLHILEKGETANPKGPQRKLISGVIADLKEAGYQEATKVQIEQVIGFLLNAETEDLDKIANDPKQPIYVKMTAKRLSSAKDKDFDNLTLMLLDRAYGKALQREESTNSVSITGAKPITPEQAAELLKIINGDSAGV